MEVSADAEAVVIYPSGLETDRGTGWDLNADSDDLLFVDALLAQYTSELCIDEKRVFATGHSYGGCMSNSVGCFRAGTFRAIAPVAGSGPFGFNVDCSGQVAALVMHSPYDALEDYSSAVQGCTRWLRANGCDESPECGCYWEESLDEPEDECLQEAQEPYTPGVPVETSECDEREPVFRQYQNCDPAYPVVTADYWRRERQEAGDPSERWHNPPPWAPDVIWEFFVSLPPTD
jgi:poly(3-hydroxybutyrate) depolymerase